MRLHERDNIDLYIDVQNQDKQTEILTKIFKQEYLSRTAIIDALKNAGWEVKYGSRPPK